jgi:outer membrane protein OmpA-like peptidoglycan-associated protein
VNSKSVVTLGAVLAATLCASLSHAQTVARTYTDSRGTKVNFPLGDASFADEIVDFKIGAPPPSAATGGRWSDPRLALSPPDYIDENTDRRKPTAVTLGCGGTLIIRLADNALVDVPGPDLYVFEVGPAIEATSLSISPDGRVWTPVGNIGGGTAQVDVSKAVVPGELYRYVRLTDLKTSCGGDFPGADIDAVGAIGSAVDLALDALVLFESGQSILRPQAHTALNEVATRISSFPGAAVTIQGHTDNLGGADYNMKLSRARADAVSAFLQSLPALKGRVITAAGFGATRPIASNDTEEGRGKNRRVQIAIVPRN